MTWASISLMDLERRGQRRLDWADIAKAISIILLVIYTTIGEAWYVNDLLILARMPLFFFVSGLFAWRVIVDADLGAFLRDRLGNLLYLYAIWTWLLYLTTKGVASLLFGAPFFPKSNLYIFVDPPLTIWFLYALAIAFAVTRLVRRIPVWLVLAVALAAYSVAVWTGDWRHMGFGERLVRLYPFFLLGLVARPFVGRIVEQCHRWWPAMGALFFALAWAILDSPVSAFAPATFLVTLIGIFWLLLVSRSLSEHGWSRPIAIVGTATLHIYVLQRVQLYYLNQIRDALDLTSPAWGLVEALIIVAVGTVFGRWAATQPGMVWLFQAPWIDSGPPRSGMPSRA